MSDEKTILREGACRCGGVSAGLLHPASSRLPAARECDCDYCREHDGAWMSLPEATLTIRSASPLVERRQGSMQARFLHCSACGDMIAVVAEFEGALLGALRAGLLADRDDDSDPVVSSPQTLSPEAKASRWQELWSPTTIDIAGKA